MPRERISTTYHRETPNSPEPTQPTNCVEVIWDRDRGYIQVATTVSDSIDRTLNYVGSWLEAANLPTADLELLRKKLATDPPLNYFDGWYATLERREDINHLIRVAKRARDAAFGRDE